MLVTFSLRTQINYTNVNENRTMKRVCVSNESSYVFSLSLKELSISE